MTNSEDLIKALLYVQSTQKSMLDRVAELAGRQASWQVRQKTRIASLDDVEFRVYSQWGEDGIIDWLVERIDVSAERFVEFGVESYVESNTRFLLKQRNWKGLVIDRSEEYVRLIKNDEISWRHDLTALAHFITRDNINALFTRGGFAGPIGLLSIDIDGMDYWVWERVSAVRPDIVICEYNAAFGDVHPLTIPHNADFERFKAHHSGCYFGASIDALCRLAARKGYSLVGTNSAGCNAFFVLNEHYAKLEGQIADKRPRAARFRPWHDHNHQLDHRITLEVVEELMSLPVQRVDTEEIMPLGQLKPLFSAEWLRQMQASG